MAKSLKQKAKRAKRELVKVAAIGMGLLMLLVIYAQYENAKEPAPSPKVSADSR
jgi:hypothetical protein